MTEPVTAAAPARSATSLIRTPDQRVRVFVSSTLRELEPERQAVRDAVRRLRLAPVMFELGARPHPARDLYRAYLAQSQVFVGIYWQSYGWVAPDEDVSGLEDEYRLAGTLPKLIYVKTPAPQREPRLSQLLTQVRDDDRAAYKRFSTPEELRELVENDLALLLSERFASPVGAAGGTVEVRGTGSIPVPPTSLVDRENELARTQQLLRDGARLVTFTGAGGIGKSRLAVEVASRLASSFPDGAWFVPLASVSAPEEVAAAVARALGLRRSGDQAPVEDLRSYLRDRRLLLVLDNFEQVADAAPVVAQLLAAAPQVQVLVTSRTVLRLSGEHGIDVPPLAAPREGVGLGADEARRYPAVQLFVARAAAVNQDFVLTDANAADVAEICRRLDGLPLALELAAARVRLLTPQALRSRLDDRLGLLAGGARDLPERQRTLRGTIAWSHDLLTSEQQEVFARLGVFAGGFDLPAAEAVCGTDVLEVLGALVDDSLVRQTDLRGEPRFSLLGTIRQFALERLRETADWREAHDRHADHYLALAQAAEPELKGPDQLEWLDRLDTEADNLDAAMTRFLATDRIESAVALSWALWLYWWFHGHVEDGGRWMEEILSRSGSLPDLPRAWAASGAGVMAFARGDYRRAEDLLARGLDLFRRLHFKPGIAGALVIPGQLATFRGEYDRACELLEESLALFRELGEDWNVAIVLNFLGAIPLNQGDPHRAGSFFTEALAVARRVGDRLAIRVSLYNLASVRRALADDRGARDLLLEGLRLSADAGDQASVAYGLEGLAMIEQEPGRAARLFGAAEALLEAQGGAPVYAYTPDRTTRDRSVETLRSRTDGAAFTAAWTEGRGMAARQAVEYAVASVESTAAAPEPGGRARASKPLDRSASGGTIETCAGTARTT